MVVICTLAACEGDEGTLANSAPDAEEHPERYRESRCGSEGGRAGEGSSRAEETGEGETAPSVASIADIPDIGSNVERRLAYSTLKPGTSCWQRTCYPKHRRATACGAPSFVHGPSEPRAAGNSRPGLAGGAGGHSGEVPRGENAKGEYLGRMPRENSEQYRSACGDSMFMRVQC